MARFKEDQINEFFAPQLQEGETIEHFAYGIKQPNMLFIGVLMLFGYLPGAIAMALLTKHYVVGTSADRLLVLEIKGKTVKETRSFPLDAMPNATTKTGWIFTHLKVEGEPPFVVKFHRMGMPNNREMAMAIGAKVTGQPLIEG